MVRQTLVLVLCALACAVHGRAPAAEMEWIKVAQDKKSFVRDASGKRFTPWGFNYDRDHEMRLLEDYWEAEWPKVEEHFAQMRKLGANVVRVHLQLGKFMAAADKPKDESLKQLDRLVKLAEQSELYLDITGLGCYHKKDVPAWYDTLAEQDRWNVQARFWEAIARRCADSPAVFCYDLMNEPIAPVGRSKERNWLGPALGGKHYVQYIALDAKDRPRSTIARQWIAQLAAAIRKHDRKHFITVGLVDWSLERPGLQSGFVPEKIVDELDFISVHLYPNKGKVDEDLKTLAGFAVGRPVVIEEMFPLKCSMDELDAFVEGSKKHAAGWIGFYWGKPPEELRKSKELGDVLTAAWLEFFTKKAKSMP